MDSRTKFVLQNHLRYWVPTPTGTIKGYGTVIIAGTLFISKLQHTLYRHILRHVMVAYISNKLCIDEKRPRQQIDWDCIMKVRHEVQLTTSAEMYIQIDQRRHRATRAVMQKRKQRISSN